MKRALAAPLLALLLHAPRRASGSSDAGVERWPPTDADASEKCAIVEELGLCAAAEAISDADAPTRTEKLRNICVRCPSVGSRVDCPLACRAYAPARKSERPAALREQNADFERICAAPEAAAVYLAYCC